MPFGTFNTFAFAGGVIPTVEINKRLVDSFWVSETLTNCNRQDCVFFVMFWGLFVFFE